MIALYVGGMGAKGQNFHLDAVARLGYEAECDVIQERYLAGDKAGAIAAVPLVLRDGHHRVPTLRDYDTRRPALRA